MPAHVADQGLLKPVVPYKLIVWSKAMNETVYVEDFGVSALRESSTMAHQGVVRVLHVLEG
jgi:hypothetical protein